MTYNMKFIPMLKAYGIKRILNSYDFKLALLIAVIFGACIFYYNLASSLIPTIFTTYATISSAMIAIVIASLAIVATMADSEFIAFLNDKKPLYNNILFVFWYTTLFSALAIAIAVSAYLFITINPKDTIISSWLIIISTFFTVYNVLSVVQAVGAVMGFGLLRAEFAKINIRLKMRKNPKK